jgi:hypothetical protein
MATEPFAEDEDVPTVEERLGCVLFALAVVLAVFLAGSVVLELLR